MKGSAWPIEQHNAGQWQSRTVPCVGSSWVLSDADLEPSSVFVCVLLCAKGWDDTGLVLPVRSGALHLSVP